MAKTIYCSLLLLVLCLTYEAYGNLYAVRYVSFPSRRISSNIGTYDLSSPYSSSLMEAAEANESVADSEVASESGVKSSSPSLHSKNSLSLNNSSEHDRHRGLGPNSEFQHGTYYRQHPHFMNSGDLNNENIQNSMNSNFQDIPNFKKVNQFDRRVARQNSLSPSYNIDDSQQISQPNKPMFTTFSNGDSDLSDRMTKLIDKRFKSFDHNSFRRLWGNMGDFQEAGKPTNMQLGSMTFSTIIPSTGSSNNMDSYVIPQKRKPNYPYSDPIGLSKDEADEIRNQALRKSNLYRNKYKLKLFILDDQLNNCAQDWANQMAKLKIFGHRENNEYGENLYSSSELNNLGEKAVENWYNEIIGFNIANGEDGLISNTSTHHMTQLLWKSSTKMGVGVSKSPNGMYYLVANYDPRGNVMDSFKINLPDIKQKDIEEANESQKSKDN